MKKENLNSRVFRKYSAPTFEELERFASEFGFKIVDRYYTYSTDHKRHIPCIETF